MEGDLIVLSVTVTVMKVILDTFPAACLTISRGDVVGFIFSLEYLIEVMPISHRELSPVIENHVGVCGRN